MATTFKTFDSTPTNLVADVKAAILTSSDYSNPAGNRVLATTTRGADICVDLSDAAATTKIMQLGVYRTAALADKSVRYINNRIPTSGTSTDPLHCIVSAGKEHLYISVEGPRTGEPNPDVAANGSLRQCLFVGDVTPYFAADTIPTVVSVGIEGSSIPSSYTAYVGRNQANTASWVPARLASLHPPIGSDTSSASSLVSAVQRIASDGKTYLFPYVIFEDTAGMRGRITKCFFAGYNTEGSGSGVADPLPTAFSKVTYGADTYILLPVSKGYGTSAVYQAFGATSNNTGVFFGSPVIAIPFS